jgi:murein DD-endopeptidase MepM/ murein hydrolase activator NlpD
MTLPRRATALCLFSLLLAVLLGLPAPRAAALVMDPAPSGGGVWPLSPEPEVRARFDPPATRYGPGHRGVDLAGAPGQVVLSTLSGRVTFAGRVAGRGVVVVGHGVTRTTYEPVSATVGVGDSVEAGEPLGTLETFGSHCGLQACLHWGLVRGETYLDPLSLVGAGPVRLLPLDMGLLPPLPVRGGLPTWDGGLAGGGVSTTRTGVSTRAAASIWGGRPARDGSAALPSGAGAPRPV